MVAPPDAAASKAAPRPVETAAAARPLAGMHAVITGASRGIGAAIARELARLGADLSIVGRSERTLRAIAPALVAAGASRVNPIAADVTDEAAVAAAFVTAAEALGSPQILVNNAGGVETAPFVRSDPKLWRRMLDLNLTSVYLCCRAAIPGMTAGGWGRVINVASTAGLTGYPYVSAYVAAKHGVVGLTRALAAELARTGVTVNAVCPGYTDTPMLDAAVSVIAEKTRHTAEDVRTSLAAANPMGRLVKPEEVAAAVGWLTLPASASVNGQAIAIAGGEVM